MSRRNRRGRSRHPPQDVVMQDNKIFRPPQNIIFERLNFMPPNSFNALYPSEVNDSCLTIPVSFKVLPNYIKKVCHVMAEHNMWQRTRMENVDVIVKGALILAEAKVCCAQKKTWLGSTREQYDDNELTLLDMMTRKLPYPLALYLDCLGNTKDGRRTVTPVLAEHATNPEWSGALTWAPKQLLPLLLELHAGVEKYSPADAVRSELQGLPKIEWEEYTESGTQMIRLSDESFNFWVEEDRIRWTHTDRHMFTQNFKFFNKAANITVDLLKGEGSQAQFVQTSEWQVGKHVEWFVMTAVDDRYVQLGTAFRLGATRSDANDILTGPKENAYMLGILNPTPIFNKILSCYDQITGSSMRTHPNPDAFSTRAVAKLMSKSLMPLTSGPHSVNGPVKIPVSFTGLPGFIDEVWETMKVVRLDTTQRVWTMDNKDVFIKGSLILAEAKVCCAQKKCDFNANVSQHYTWSELISLNELANMKLPYPLAMYLECLGNTRDRSREVTPVLAEHATNPEWSGALTWAPRQLLPLFVKLHAGVEKDSPIDSVRSNLLGLPKIEWEEYNSESGTQMVRLTEDSFNFWVMEDTQSTDDSRYKIRWNEEDSRMFSRCIMYLDYGSIRGFNIPVNLLHGMGSPAQFVQIEWEAGKPVAWFAMTEVDDVSARLGAAFRFSAVGPIANHSVLNGTRGNAYMYDLDFEWTVRNILSWVWRFERNHDWSDSSD